RSPRADQGNGFGEILVASYPGDGGRADRSGLDVARGTALSCATVAAARRAVSQRWPGGAARFVGLERSRVPALCLFWPSEAGQPSNSRSGVQGLREARAKARAAVRRGERTPVPLAASVQNLWGREPSGPRPTCVAEAACTQPHCHHRWSD